MKLAFAALLLFGRVGIVVAAPAGNLSRFAFHPHPGALLPLATPLVDEHGAAMRLGQFFAGKPVIVVLDYLRCKNLCGLTLDRLAAAADRLPLDPGRDFAVLAISIDPRDRPADLAAAKTRYLKGYDAADRRGWHFLGGRAADLRQIADAIGFPYLYDKALDQYIHPAGFVVAAPDGRISRYILGIGGQPAALQAALADAARDKSIGPLTRILLLCHGEGLPLGRYSLAVEAAFLIANLAAMTGGVVIFAAIWRRRHG